MPEIAHASFREVQPSNNQALAEQEEAMGKTVLILEVPELNVA